VTRALWCVLGLFALFLIASQYSSRQIDADRQAAYRELATRQVLVDSVMGELERADRDLTAIRDSVAQVVADASSEAAERAQEARSAQMRGDTLSRRLEALLSRPARHVFDSIRVAHRVQVRALEGLVAARDRIIAAQKIEISGWISNRVVQDSVRQALEGSIVSRDRLISELERPKGVNLFGWYIDVKCGPTIAGGISTRGGVDAVIGLGCAVG
jgi:hypothetical protein